MKQYGEVTASGEEERKADSNAVGESGYSKEDYAKAKFWDDRYLQKQSFFDWYAEFPELKKALIEQFHLGFSDRILMVGCGNSKLSQQMYEAGFKTIINIDISASVIEQMKLKFPHMEWLVMDATSMDYPDGAFDAVIDKGTLDALIAGKNYAVCQDMLKECIRVTGPAGQIIEITYGSPEGRKGVFKNSLPFQSYDYYYCKANLNDISTMINLMRSHLNGKGLSKILTEKDALLKSMRDFTLIKMMRRSKKYQKVYVIWTDFPTKPPASKSQKMQEEKEMKTQQKKEQKKEEKEEKEEKAEEKTEAKEQKTEAKEEEEEEEEKEQPQHLVSDSKKQSFVYVYSIRRKVVLKMGQMIKKYSVLQLSQMFPGEGAKLSITGDQLLHKLWIRTQPSNWDRIRIAAKYCQENGLAHCPITACPQLEGTGDENSFAFNLLSGVSKKNKMLCLKKSTVVVELKCSPRVNINNMVPLHAKASQICGQLTEKCNLHPCPKAYALFSMLKGRHPAGHCTVNKLLQQYWYPTFRMLSLNKDGMKLEISLPPLNQHLQHHAVQFIKAGFSCLQSELAMEEPSNGFISFPSLKLLNLLNMASISYNAGQKFELSLQDFANEDDAHHPELQQYLQQGQHYNEIDNTIALKTENIEKVLVHAFCLF